MSICDNLQQIQQQIQQCCQQAQRQPQEVQLLAVSKTKPFSDVLSAYQAGQRAFGENYVQEGVEKIQASQQQNLEIEWHFIGPLQSNKSRLVAEHFAWMQTLDRAKIASRLHEQRPAQLEPLNVLIQINISDEQSKSGIQPEQMLELAQHIQGLDRLRLRGLMAIPAPTSNPAEQQSAFQAMQQLFQQLQQALPQAQIDTLSMGMSDDMPMAIQSGSTMVRIGTAIFGKRDYGVKE